MIVRILQLAAAVVFWLNLVKFTGSCIVQTKLVRPFVEQENTISLQVKSDDLIVTLPGMHAILTKVVPSECMAHTEAVLEAPDRKSVV